MKKFLIVLVLNAIASSLNAQDTDYRPLIEDGKTWVSFNPHDLSNYNGYNGPWMGYTQYDKIEGDTIINGHPCKFWNQHYVSRVGNIELFVKIPVYEENRKVYFFLEGDKEPRLAFNFGAEIGDTIIAQSIEGLYINYYWKYLSEKYEYANLWSDTLCIKSIEKMNVGGREQKVFYYTSHLFNEEQFMKDVYLMEGIGSNETSVQNIGPNIISWNGIAQLIYCTLGDEVLYFDAEGATKYGLPLPTSVTSPSDKSVNCKSVNSKFHDLSGRGLPTLPTRPGVYIKDGRKVLIK